MTQAKECLTSSALHLSHTPPTNNGNRCTFVSFSVCLKGMIVKLFKNVQG